MEPQPSQSSLRPRAHPAPATPSPQNALTFAPTSENHIQHRSSHRKLHKRRPPTMDFPEQLKRRDGDEEHEEDVLPMALSQANRPFSMNQSIFGLIAAAGSKVDFQDRFEGHSSDDEAADQSDDEQPSDHKTTDPMAQTTVLRQPGTKSGKGHRRKFSDGKLMKSVPILSRLSSKKSRSKKEGKKPVSKIQEESELESLAIDAEPLSPENQENLAAPVMSRMLEARAEATARPSFDLERVSIDKARETRHPTSSKLSQRLQKIFEFDEPENIVSGLCSSPLLLPPPPRFQD